MRPLSALLILPVVLVFLTLFGAYVVFFFSSLATLEAGGIRYGSPFGVHNYIRYLHSSAELNILFFTVYFSIFVTLIVAVIGYPIGYFLVRTERKWIRSLVLGVLVVSFFSGTVTRAYSWVVLLGNNGIVNQTLVGSGLVERPVRLIYNLLGVTIGLVHFLLPYFIFTMLGALKNLSRDYEEAARDLGAGSFRVLRTILLPLSLSGLLVAGTLVYSLALSAFVIPLLLGGGRVGLVSNAIYRQISINFDLPYAAASSAIYLIVAFATIGIAMGLQRRMGKWRG
jgi:putative spermidine/putrescine transport system permease protein